MVLLIETSKNENQLETRRPSIVYISLSRLALCTKPEKNILKHTPKQVVHIKKKIKKK